MVRGILLAGACCSGLLLAACGDGEVAGSGGGGGGVAAAPQAVTLRFAARDGDRDVSCASGVDDVGDEGGAAHLRDLRFFVHDVRLVAADGTEAPVTLDEDGTWQTAGVALLDFEDATGACEHGTPGVHEALTGTVPAGSYAGVRFKVGVPFELNHADPTLAAPPLDTTALYWGWGEGYMFLQLSLMTTPPSGGKDNAWAFGLASMGCEGDPRHGEVVACGQPNRPEIDLDGFDAASDVVVVDLHAILEGARLLTDHGCTSAPSTEACGPIFSRFGLDYATGTTTPSTLTAFRVASGP